MKMEKSFLNLEKPIKAARTENPHSMSNKLSISAFLFFIFVCFSMLHFHPSPAELFHNTKFLFVLSNTLILIIAVDSGAFSSSKQKYDSYEEYLITNRSRISDSSYKKSTNATSIVKELPEPENVVKFELEKLPVSIQPEGKKLAQTVPEDNFENSVSLDENRTETSKEEETHVEEEACKPKEFRGSMSVEATSLTGNEEKKNLSRSATEGHDQSRTEEEELWAMSDEELNRRVEEFIRFNKEMRIQETKRLVMVGEN